MKKETQIVSLGRDKKWTKGVINPPVFRASTMLFETMDEMRFAAKNKANGAMFYGRRGGPTHFAFQAAIAELEGGWELRFIPLDLLRSVAHSCHF